VDTKAPSIAIADLFVYFSGRPALAGVSLTLGPGTSWGLIGPSGSGKSVLLKAIAGIQAADRGEVSFSFGEGSTQEVPSVGLMFQEGALFDSFSVFDNVAFPLVRGDLPVARHPKEERNRIRDTVHDILSRVGLSWAWAKMPAELSGGMRRRVSLARALIGRPKILLLDDPTSGLDPIASSVIMELIVEIRSELGATMVVVSQDLRRLLPKVPAVIALIGGEVRAQCPTKDLAGIDAEVAHFVSCRYDLSGNSPELPGS
jgi:phospholipid/cholesterol/gamma-HCH transport system ATP-binding protein